MGDIAEMMLDGSLCQYCGVYIDDNYNGNPRTCEVCKEEEEEGE